MVIDYFLYRCQRYTEKKLKKQYDGRFVAMFHQIDDEKNWYNDQYSITFLKFQKFIYELQRNRYEFVAPQNIVSNDAKKKVVLSFDDVFEGVYHFVYPFLKQQNIPFVLFPAVCNLQTKGYITQQMLMEMVNEYSGCFVGAHSLTHCNLLRCPKKKVYSEIVDSGEILEQVIGRKVELFAYPYGSLVEVGRRELLIASQRYRLAFGTMQAGVTDKVNPMYIPRININEDTANRI